MKPIDLAGLVTKGTAASWAVMSGDNCYRYVLGRSWDPEPDEPWEGHRPIFSVVMLNPSTASHDVDDPTIRKLIHFGKQEGCGGLLVRNLFALRATDPRDLVRALVRAADPVGQYNLGVLGLPMPFCMRVAAWGNIRGGRRLLRLAHASIGMVEHVASTFVFGLNKSGQPKHPLYLPNSTRVIPWRQARGA